MKSFIISSTCLLLLPQTTYADSAYTKAKASMRNAPSQIKETLKAAPKSYSFSSRFNSKDSVSHPGQTFRQVLNDDLKTYMSKLKRGMFSTSKSDAVKSMNSYFSFKSNASTSYKSINGDSLFKKTAKDIDGDRALIYEGMTYNDLQMPGKNLIGKIAGNDNVLRNGELKGWNTTKFNNINLKDISNKNENSKLEPEDLIQAFFKITANNAVDGDSFVVTYKNGKTERITDASVTPEGLNLAQLTQKLIHGSVSFSQASGDYLSTDLGSKKGLNVDNIKQYKNTKNYTALEHHWDEAFGYFGASRDYLSYSDIQIKKKVSIDSDDDGEISLLREKNYGLSINASRVDLKIGTDLTSEIVKAFIAGRHLISEQPKGYKSYIKKQAAIAIGAWEKVFAGMTIHYINSTLKTMNAYGSSSYLFYNYSKYWSEMKGFAMAYQFNPNSMLELKDFNKFHELVGDKPVLMESSDSEVNKYKKNLLAARAIIAEAFGFSKSKAEKL